MYPAWFFDLSEAAMRTNAGADGTFVVDLTEEAACSELAGRGRGKSIFAGSINCLNGCGDGLDRTQRACAERDTPIGQAGGFTAAADFSDAALSLTACATYAGTMDDRIGRSGIISRRMT